MNERLQLDRSKWANPFVIGDGYTREESLLFYENYIRSTPKLFNSLHEIDGKTLGCFCSPSECHGDILIKLRSSQVESKLPTLVGSTEFNAATDKPTLSTSSKTKAFRFAPAPSYASEKKATPFPNDSNSADSHIAIFIDSNRRHIDFHSLFPKDRVIVHPCGTVQWAMKNLPTSLDSATSIIIHLGTNDIESRSPQQVHQSLLEMKNEIESRFHGRVLISSILPRDDSFMSEVISCNKMLSNSLQYDLIPHGRISISHLHDKKHLSFNCSSPKSFSGCQLLATDFYVALYGRTPDPSIMSAIAHYKPSFTSRRPTPMKHSNTTNHNRRNGYHSRYSNYSHTTEV